MSNPISQPEAFEAWLRQERATNKRIVRCPICTNDVPAGGWHECTPTETWEQIMLQLNSLQSQIKEVERDAMRYRALRDSGNYCPGTLMKGWSLSMSHNYDAPSLDASADELLG